MDLTSVADTALTLASVAVTTAIPILVPYILKRLNIANNTDLANTMTTALDAAAGEAYRIAQAHEGGLANVAVHNTAVAAGVDYAIKHVPDVMKALGISPNSVEGMVKARLGALLATDPTVTAGAPVPAAVAPVAVVPEVKHS